MATSVWITPPKNKKPQSPSLSKYKNGKWLRSLQEFHHNRRLEFAHVRSGLGIGLTKQNIQDAVPLIGIKQTTLNKSTGSVRIVPTHPAMLDPLLNEWNPPLTIDEHQVKIRFSNTEDFLCVCNLPLHVTDELFQEFVEKFGPIERSFLIYDNITGDHKGYGLVQYSNRAVAFQAKNLLHRNRFDSNVLFCDWLDHKVVAYSELYSKCLYVESLPLHFRDVGRLRALFSKHYIPLYCQIGNRSGETSNFALVEYDSHTSADQTKEKLDGCPVDDSKIKIHFSMPGRSALQLYNNFVTELLKDAKKKEGLLPIPQLANQRLPLLPVPRITIPTIFQPHAPTMPLGNGSNLQSFKTIRKCLLNNSMLHCQFQNLMNAQMGLIQNAAFSTVHNNPCPRKTTGPLTVMQNSRNLNENSGSNATNSAVVSRAQTPNKEKENSNEPIRPITDDPKTPSCSPSINETSAICKNQSKPLLETPSRNWVNSGAPLDPKLHPPWNLQKAPSPSIWRNRSPLLPEPNGRKFLGSACTEFEPEVPCIKTEKQPLLDTPQPRLRPRVVDRWKSAGNTNDSFHFQYSTVKETGKKRKTHHLLPTPEASPETSFIGQHSQGLGGHYADSHCKKFRAANV